MGGGGRLSARIVPRTWYVVTIIFLLSTHFDMAEGGMCLIRPQLGLLQVLKLPKNIDLLYETTNDEAKKKRLGKDSFLGDGRPSIRVINTAISQFIALMA